MLLTADEKPLCQDSSILREPGGVKAHLPSVDGSEAS